MEALHRPSIHLRRGHWKKEMKSLRWNRTIAVRKVTVIDDEVGRFCDLTSSTPELVRRIYRKGYLIAKLF